MFTKIKDVIVEKISLVTSGNTPAVPEAETKFAFFKSIQGQTQKIHNEKIQKISDTYARIANILSPNIQK